MSKIRLQTLNFYKESRDAWKEKHCEKQHYIRALKIRIRDLAASRDLWKQRTKELEDEIKKKRKQD